VAAVDDAVAAAASGPTSMFTFVSPADAVDAAAARTTSGRFGCGPDAVAAAAAGTVAV
jgi:hypothetical protein